jgi:hypothetical protein
MVNLDNIFRDAHDNLCHGDGSSLTRNEVKELTCLWQDRQVELEEKIIRDEACSHCGQFVCICDMFVAAWFPNISNS